MFTTEELGVIRMLLNAARTQLEYFPTSQLETDLEIGSERNPASDEVLDHTVSVLYSAMKKVDEAVELRIRRENQ